MSADNNYKDFEKQFEEAWEHSSNPKDVVNADKLYNKIHEQITEDSAPSITKTFWPKRMAIAASLAGIIALAVFFVSRNNKQENIIVANDTKAVQFITLPDNSAISLEPGSTITYHKKFGTQHRELSLQGTAEFKVVKNTTHPFTVYSANSITQVTGTVFKVYNSYGTDTITSIKVSEGKVSFRAAGSSIQEAVMLEKGDSAMLNKELTRIEADHTRDKATVSKPLLKFRNSSFDKVVDSLEARFNKKFVVQKKIVKTITVEFSNESIETILTVLSVPLDFQYEIKDNQVIIR